MKMSKPKSSACIVAPICISKCNSNSIVSIESSVSAGKCVIYDVISMYCHHIILNPKDRTKNSHRLHYFLERLGRSAIVGRMYCSVRLAGLITKVSHPYPAKVDNTNYNGGNQDNENNDYAKDDNVVPLVEYKPDDWKELLTDLQSMRDLFIEGEANVDLISRDYFTNKNQSQSHQSQSQSQSQVKKRDRVRAERDLASMNIFNKLFDDIINFGTFHHALTFIRTHDVKDNLPIPPSDIKAFQ